MRDDWINWDKRYPSLIDDESLKKLFKELSFCLLVPYSDIEIF